MMDNKTFLIAGIVIACVIGVLAVFFASGDPDGLESTALYVQGEKELLGHSPEEGDPEALGTGTAVFEAPFPDYAMSEDLGTPGAVFIFIVGIILTMIVAIGAVKIINSVKQ